MTFRYGHAIAYKTKTDRQRIKIVASSSELPARLVSTPRKPELVPQDISYRQSCNSILTENGYTTQN